MCAESNSDNAMVTTIKQHWPEYVIEAAGLGFFMVAACFGTALLWYPQLAGP